MSEPLFRDVGFDTLRNAIYHTERRAFFDFVNRLVNFSVVVLGASVAAKAAALFSFQEIWLELSVVFIATAQLVFDFGWRAREHEFLQKRYYELMAEMEAGKSQSDTDKRRWSAKLLTISADEPMAMRALDALAYNKAIDATIADPQEASKCRLHVPWHHRRLRHFWAFQGAQYLPTGSRPGLILRCRAWIKSKRGGL